MRIGVVTTSYPRFADDPAGNFVGEHVAALRALGHEVEVIAADDDHGRSDVVRIRSEGLFYTGGAPDLLEGTPSRIVSAAKFSARLIATIARRAQRWDSIVAHWLAPSGLACLIAAPRTPLLAIAHGGDIHTLRRLRLLAPALHLLRARDAQLVFVSEDLREIAHAAVSRNTATWIADARVQPMGIDLERFAWMHRERTGVNALRSDARPSQTIPTLAIVSRLVPVKGVDVAIAAMPHLRHRVRLVIAGHGPELERLMTLAYGSAAPRPAPDKLEMFDPRELHALEVTHGIGFRLATHTRARDRLLAEASVVLVPSRIVRTRDRDARYARDLIALDRDARAGRTEGTPLIALEALAAGAPVVASDVGGLRNLAGVVRVPPDDPRALAAAIDRVLDAPPDSEKLRGSVAHLDWKRVVHALVRTA